MGLGKLFNTAVDKVGSVSDLVSSNKERITKYIVDAILLLVILIVFGCLDFATLRFHYEYLQNISYWTGIITKMIADICALNIGINFVIDDVIKRDKVLSKVKEVYEKLNEHRQEDFEYFVRNVYNVKLKKLAYIAKINKKIYILNKVAKSKDKILYTSKLESNQALKKKNKYCIHRSRLEYLKSEEYIDENIDSLDVRFRDVDPSVFEMEIDCSQKVDNAKVNGSLGKGRAIISINVAWSVILISMLTTSIVLEADKEQFETQAIQAMHYCQKALSDAGIVIWQFLHGMLKTKSLVSKELTNPFAERVKVLKEYYAWREKNGKWVPQAYIDIKNIDKKSQSEEVIEKEVEMTEEEYNALMNK